VHPAHQLLPEASPGRRPAPTGPAPRAGPRSYPADADLASGLINTSQQIGGDNHRRHGRTAVQLRTRHPLGTALTGGFHDVFAITACLALAVSLWSRPPSCVAPARRLRRRNSPLPGLRAKRSRPSPQEIMMRTRRHARWYRALWRAICRVAALRHIHNGQTLMWELRWQASRAAVPETRPPTWVRTLDGYWLAGRPPARRPQHSGRRHPVTLGPGAGRHNGAPPHYLGRPAHLWITAARRPRRATPVVDPDVACQP